MGPYPHRVDPQQEQATRRTASDAAPVIPQPLPEANRRGSRAAVAVMLAALAVIVLVVLL